MFKKKPQIKNLSPLRSSDRRKLADQIISDYQLSVSKAPEANDQPTEGQENGDGDASAKPQATLSSIRTSLLPDSTSSARFTTTSGPNATLISGTVYVGTHPGQDERVLWIQYGKDPKLIPTVYTLWYNPGIVPLLHTSEFVIEKLGHGADLMIPGLVKAKETKWDQRASKGAVVAVAGMQRDTVPVWVGICDIDVYRLGEDLRGQKGIAVKGIHWEGDELWNWGAHGNGGREAPAESLDGWLGLAGGLDVAVDSLMLDDDVDDERNNGGAVLKDSRRDDGVAEFVDMEEDREPTTKEVDEAFHEAFLYALYKARESNKPPHYGFQFPIQPSFVVASMVQPNLRSQNQHYTIKKTSWKTVKKFIKQLNKEGLVKSKDRNGGETVILDVDADDQQVKAFKPYKLPKPKTSTASGTSQETGDSSSTGDQSVGQKLTIKTVFRASSKLVPTLLPSKTEFYTAQQISTAIKSYIDDRPELRGQGTSSTMLDPFLANNILGSNPSQDDSKALATGRIARGALQRRVLEDDHLCQPYHIIVRNQAESEQKPKAGPPPRIHITIEKRTGSKVVTKISNLEPFHINPQQLAPELQKKCAGSASAGQLTGGKPGLLEVVVQGDQRKVLVEDVLAKRGIDSKWIDVVDKTKSTSKK